MISSFIGQMLVIGLYYLVLLYLTKLICVPEMKKEKSYLFLVFTIVIIQIVCRLLSIQFPVLSFPFRTANGYQFTSNVQTELLIFEFVFYIAILVISRTSITWLKIINFFPIIMFLLLLHSPSNTFADFLNYNLGLENNMILIFIIYMARVLNALVILILFWLWCKKGISQISLSLVDYICLILVDVMVIFTPLILYIIIGNQVELYHSVLAYNLFFLILIEVVMIYYILGRKYQQYIRNQAIVKEQYYQMQMLYFKQYKESQEQIRRIRHDMLNHLQVLRSFNNDTMKNEYIDRILLEFEQGKVQYYSGNMVLDAIIHSKLKSIKEELVAFTLTGGFEDQLLLQSFSICTIFGNAMDNALEAVKKLTIKERFITLNIQKVQSFWYIELSNSFDGTLQKREGVILSSKPNIEEHGYGLHNIRTEIEKNLGHLDITSTDKVFTLKIVLPK